ncbi:NADH-quinone oxidoreductase subunit J [Usitatibacter rugosus]|uniref:NADH-quinone oxidoreductase subunit J n=1 Tax=Usitatibacter rugosus TaxID=2732067 RepID=A0A6M4GYF3_9PROT|nr:NADH-quinone oxidoreductase subunit J [Usitatibacter rugosus]QJR12310.1 NADH-quinone oxidoreductase subunit J [Usitatibacter rugosus]
MTASQVLFYFFGTVLVLSALRVITARNPVHAALFLVLCFFNAAAIWLLAYAEFLAITLVLVYVGAVMVLFLFVVMMLDINFDKLREGFWSYLPLAGLVGFLMAFEMAMILYTKVNITEIPVTTTMPAGSNTKALGAVLYTDYLLAFELAAVILLVAIVAAIAITLRRRKESKYQDPREQLAANAGNRLKIIKGVK